MKYIGYPVKSGVVIVTKTPLKMFYHAGIVSSEEGENFVYHNDPDEKNKAGGNIMRVPAREYLSNKHVIEIYDSGLTTEQIKQKIAQHKDKSYNWLSFNCEHFIYEISGQRLKRSVLHSGEKIAIAIIAITGVLMIIGAINSKK